MFFFSGHVIIQGNEGVAQGLEQAAHNRLVVGSNPTALTRIFPKVRKGFRKYSEHMLGNVRILVRYRPDSAGIKASIDHPTALTRIFLKYVRILGSLTNFSTKEKA